MEKYYFAYKTTNLVNGSIYIGVHESYRLKDRYLGSGKLIRQAIKKYGRHNFKRDIIQFFETKEESYAYETEVVNSEFIADPNVYNITVGGLGVIVHSPEGLKALSDYAKDHVMAKDLVTNKVVKITKADFDNNRDRYAGHTVGKKVMRNSNDELVVADSNTDCADLVGITKGRAKVIDDTGKTVLMSKQDPRVISGEFPSFMKGKTIVKDKNGNNFHASVDDPRFATGEITGVQKGATFIRTQETKKSCPHCGIFATGTNLKRWHLDNCKHKK